MAEYMRRWRVVEAFQYNGTLRNSDGEYCIPQWAIKAFEEGTMYYRSWDEGEELYELFIRTLEDDYHVAIGNYVVKCAKGELCVCESDHFEEEFVEVCSADEVFNDLLHKL